MSSVDVKSADFADLQASEADSDNANLPGSNIADKIRRCFSRTLEYLLF
jgi:hypothetical protein